MQWRCRWVQINQSSRCGINCGVIIYVLVTSVKCNAVCAISSSVCTASIPTSFHHRYHLPQLLSFPFAWSRSAAVESLGLLCRIALEAAPLSSITSCWDSLAQRHRSLSVISITRGMDLTRAAVLYSVGIANYRALYDYIACTRNHATNSIT